jgi:hypothetical protein
MNHTDFSRSLVATMTLVMLLSGPGAPRMPTPEAVRGFDEYVLLAERRIQQDVGQGVAFLWVEHLPDADRQAAMAQLRSGKVTIARVEAPTGDSLIRTPGAAVHDWRGIIFIPGATLDQVLETVRDYDRHQDYYSPEVAKSRTLSRNGDDFKVYLRLKKTKIVTAVFDTEHVVRYHELDRARAYSESRSVRVAEIENPGEPTERELPENEAHGFLWQLNSYWRFLERDEGVYVQCEAISLTRDVPAGLNWLIGGFIESVPRESLSFTLESTRAAVLGRFRSRVTGGNK